MVIGDLLRVYSIVLIYGPNKNDSGFKYVSNKIAEHQINMPLAITPVRKRNYFA